MTLANLNNALQRVKADMTSDEVVEARNDILRGMEYIKELEIKLSKAENSATKSKRRVDDLLLLNHDMKKLIINNREQT